MMPSPVSFNCPKLLSLNHRNTRRARKVESPLTRKLPVSATAIVDSSRKSASASDTTSVARAPIRTASGPAVATEITCGSL